MTKKKTETIQEFLERGGKITVVPPSGPKEKSTNVKSTVVGPATALSYEDADYYYGEHKKRKKIKKEPDVSNLNLNSLPEDFRKKLGL